MCVGPRMATPVSSNIGNSQIQAMMFWGKCFFPQNTIVIFINKDTFEVKISCCFQ